MRAGIDAISTKNTGSAEGVWEGSRVTPYLIGSDQFVYFSGAFEPLGQWISTGKGWAGYGKVKKDPLI